MEFGPRALGGRSILGDAQLAKMQSVMNLKIKFRESFRPFAPCVLQERVDDYFDMRPMEPSPYMLLVAPVRRNAPIRRTEQEQPDRPGQAQGEALRRCPRSRTSTTRRACRRSTPNATAATTS